MKQSLVYIISEKENGTGPWRPIEWRTKLSDADTCIEELKKQYPDDKYTITQLPGF